MKTVQHELGTAELSYYIFSDSNDLCEALEIRKEAALREDDVKYLRALSESYNNAISANVKLQILSIMADITTLQEICKYIPSLTK